jgi:hypothetical protein
MAKKSVRKPSAAAGIAIIDESSDDRHYEANEDSAAPDKPSSKGKNNKDQVASGQFSVSDIKKAAAFANSIGGLEKAIALLQILKVAKDVQ